MKLHVTQLIVALSVQIELRVFGSIYKTCAMLGDWRNEHIIAICL